MRSLSLFPVTPPAPDRRGQVLALLADSKRITTIGFWFYLLSFFLPAVGGPRGTGPLRGYFCAEFALLYPWTTQGHNILRDTPIEGISLLLSGWINPLFLLAMAFRLRMPSSSNGPALKMLTLLAIPVCWIVFAYQGYYPREGHVLWVTGMVAMLAPVWLAKLAERLALANERKRID